MPLPLNPYIAGNPVGNTSAFIGRDDILRTVLSALRQPEQNAITLYGQRRIGKTSILQALAQLLPQEGPYIPVYFDLQDKAAWQLEQVLEDLANTINRSLKLSPVLWGGDIRQQFRAEWLPGILQSLPVDSSLVLLFDEFDVLADPATGQAAADFFPYLRDLLNLDRTRLQFIFVIGRTPDDLSSIALSVFKGTPSTRVSLLSERNTEKLARISEANHSLLWSKDAIQTVWELTHGHPFLVQSLCSQVWERSYEETNTPEQVGTEQVLAAIPATLDASRNTLEWLWDGLSPAQRIVAAALAQAGAKAVDDIELERILREGGVRLVIRELQDAPKLLQDWDLLESDPQGYRFRVELLRRWIEQNRPLKRVQSEVDRVQPLAESLYNAALGYYEKEEYSEAEKSLQAALRANPSHIRANEMLADLLIVQNRLESARQLLEALYQTAPALARPRLVQVYLQLAQAEGDENTQLTLLEKIFAIQPDDSNANSLKHKIWNSRAENALEHKDLQAALVAFRNAEAWGRVADMQQAIKEEDEIKLKFINGREAISLGEWNKSISYLKEVIENHPDYVYEGESAADLFATAVREGRKALPYWQKILRRPQTLKIFNMVLLVAFIAFCVGFGYIIAQQGAKGVGVASFLATPTQTATPSFTPTASLTPTSTPTFTPTASLTPTITPSFTPTARPTIGIGNATQLNISYLPSSHQSEVLSVAISYGDSPVMASGSANGEVILWEFSTGKFLKTLSTGKGNNGINDLAFSSDGQKLAAATWNGQVWIWDLKSIDIDIDTPFQVLESESLSTAWSLNFSPDGRKLAVAYSTQDIILWNAETGTLLEKIVTDSSGEIYAVSFSAKGEFLAFGGASKALTLWNIAKHEKVWQSTGHTLPIKSISFSSNNSFVATGGDDGVICLWNFETGKVIWFQAGHVDGVNSVLFTPDSTTLISASQDKTISLWDVQTAQKLKTLSGHYGEVNDLAYSASGNVLASASSDYSVILWDMSGETEKQVLSQNTTKITALDFSPDSKTLASGSVDGKIVLWNMDQGVPVTNIQYTSKAIKRIKLYDNGKKLVFSPDEKYIALWNITENQIIKELEISSPARGIAFSPSGVNLAAIDNGKIFLWDITNGQLLKESSTFPDSQYVHYVSNNELIVANYSGYSSYISLWNSEENTSNTLVELNSYSYPRKFILRDTVVSNRSNVFFMESNDPCSYCSLSYALRSIALDKSPQPKSVAVSGMLNGLVLSPDGEILAGYRGNLVEIYDDNLVLLTTIDFYSREVSALSFSPDKKFLAVGFVDGSIALLAIQ